MENSDIVKLLQGMETRIGSRLDGIGQRLDNLEQKIDKVYTELDSKIDRVYKELDSKIDRVYDELNQKIDDKHNQVMAYIELNVEKKISWLAEGHMQLKEQLDEVLENQKNIAELNQRVLIIERVVRDHTEELNELKEAIR